MRLYGALHGIKNICQGAYKPGSVLPRGIASDLRSRGSHSSRRGIAPTLKQPTRTLQGDPPLHVPKGRAQHPYAALLRVGFTMRALLPRPRCALTAPFHPYLCPKGPSAVCSLWHFPYGYPRRALPATLGSWSPDFPRCINNAAARPPGPLTHRRGQALWEGKLSHLA